MRMRMRMKSRKKPAELAAQSMAHQRQTEVGETELSRDRQVTQAATLKESDTYQSGITTILAVHCLLELSPTYRGFRCNGRPPAPRFEGSNQRKHGRLFSERNTGAEERYVRRIALSVKKS
jgi:hypothetical protein